MLLMQSRIRPIASEANLSAENGRTWGLDDGGGCEGEMGPSAGKWMGPSGRLWKRTQGHCWFIHTFIRKVSMEPHLGQAPGQHLGPKGAQGSSSRSAEAFRGGHSHGQPLQSQLPGRPHLRLSVQAWLETLSMDATRTTGMTFLLCLCKFRICNLT